MDLGTTIIGLICIVICAIPFVLTVRGKKKKEKQLLSSLKDLAKQQNCDISEYEVCGFYAIGVDKTKNFAFFSFKKKELTKQQFVDLSTIKSCKIANIGKSTSKNGKVIERLNLNFSPNDENRSNTAFEFYNVDVNYQLCGELESIKKWNSLINNMLNANK